MGLKEIRSEIDDMEKVFNEFEPADSQGTDPPATDSPGTRPPGTDPPGTSAPATSAPATSAPATEPPPDEPEDERDRTIAELRAKLAEKTTIKPPDKPPPPPDEPVSDVDFLEGKTIDDFLTDSDSFNKLLNKVYKQGADFGRSEVKKKSELVLQSIPDIVKDNIALTATLKAVNDEFYKNNPDLVPFKKVVGAVFEEKMTENPDRTYQEILPEVATETRTRLELHRAATPQPKSTPPPLPRKKGGPRQQPKPDTDPLLSELEAMNSVLDY